MPGEHSCAIRSAHGYSFIRDLQTLSETTRKANLQEGENLPPARKVKRSEKVAKAEERKRKAQEEMDQIKYLEKLVMDKLTQAKG